MGLRRWLSGRVLAWHVQDSRFIPCTAKKKKKMLVVVLHAYNSNRRLSGGLKVQGQPGQHSETLSRKKKEKNRH
jgi:hypothetical protein